MTWYWRRFFIHFIAHISASISEWRGVKLALTFLAPIKLSKASSVLYKPCPEKISLSFQDPSVKHHHPRIDGKFVHSTCWTALCVFKTCTSTQSVDFVSAKFSVSLGSISKLLKTLSFIPFQLMYQSIHANWWSSICGSTLQNRWSIVAKRELVGKISWFDGIFDNAQTRRAGGHSKNTWFIDSSIAPHLAQHKKCFIFGGQRTFQQKAFSRSTVGSNTIGGFSLFGYTR